ncbi:hypothetical protein [Bacillus xiapuensis]|uniref:hypothetical protein n=1 Tax=Bacillus xiapuensis TaxID=2014075 RepID=UPI000C250A03|nr:hypothetical protein [Bacillus xiapuensis]
MSGKVIRYFTRGHTAKGMYSLLESNLQEMEKVFMLEGGTETEKKTCLRLLADQCLQRGMNAELIHCASDPDALEAVILTDQQAAVCSVPLARTEAAEACRHYVNIPGEKAVGAEQGAVITRLVEQANIARQNAYSCFQKALAVHDEWELIYIRSLNKQRANELTAQLIQQLLPDKDKRKKGRVKRRFLGAATPVGAVDFIGSLTDDLSWRYFIKGRPGTGKSTMMKKIAAAAEEKGYDTEVYHCGFDPNSVDMVIVRELGFAVFDSTAPHEYFPEKTNDAIIDLYEEIVPDGTDELYAEEIQDVAERYTALMHKATDYLAEAKNSKDQIESLYPHQNDEAVLAPLCSEILEKAVK